MLDLSAETPISARKGGTGRQILMVLTEEGWIPSKNNVLVRLNGLDEATEGGVYLPKSAQCRDNMAKVVAVGPRANRLFSRV
jgi:Chaperonin 10 Kd subunit.